VPAKRPRLISLVLSSPPYEPNQPARVSLSTNLGTKNHTANGIDINTIRDEDALLAHGDLRIWIRIWETSRTLPQTTLALFNNLETRNKEVKLLMVVFDQSELMTLWS
jgi:hypothetical protein